MPIFPYKGVLPQVAEGAFVAPNASLIGDVTLGERSSIWFGAVLRGDVAPLRIGARTNIQDNAVIHATGGKSSTTIGDDVTVGHNSIVHGCTIGNYCLIGMGSIVLDGASIEDECFIAAGALIAPNTRVAARSLMIGNPARKARTLTDAELTEIRTASITYVELAAQWLLSET
jgi:carbonic anhydrase/acetyltransferase-like protein (isoleucine patch superfamily)